jgi:fused signal recognition particle receptor
MSDDTFLDIAAPAEDQKASGGFLRKLRRGLSMTHVELAQSLEKVLTGKERLGSEGLEQLEESLIAADLGVEASLELVETLRQDLDGGGLDRWRVRERLVDEISILLLDAPRPPGRSEMPTVTLVVGVNGVGKTTSIAKIAHRLKQQGSSVVLAAGDTFRAAAAEQLTIWGERLGIDVIRGQAGGDPGAVVFDALKAARARGADHLLIDTAGRLHTKDHLMEELSKIRRIVDREAPDWRYRGLLVLDATTGHNAIRQAQQFTDLAAIDGVVLAKIDGTAKGGMAVAISRELRLPVLYLGVGEGVEDLIDFRPREFAATLLGQEPAG